MTAAFWRLQSSQRPWPTADGEFVETMQQVKDVVDRVRGRFPTSGPTR